MLDGDIVDKHELIQWKYRLELIRRAKLYQNNPDKQNEYTEILAFYPNQYQRSLLYDISYYEDLKEEYESALAEYNNSVEKNHSFAEVPHPDPFAFQDQNNDNEYDPLWFADETDKKFLRIADFAALMLDLRKEAEFRYNRLSDDIKNTISFEQTYELIQMNYFYSNLHVPEYRSRYLFLVNKWENYKNEKELNEAYNIFSAQADNKIRSSNKDPLHQPPQHATHSPLKHRSFGSDKIANVIKGSLGVFGVVLLYLISALFAIFPLMMLPFTFWIRFVLIFVMMFVPVVGEVVRFVLYILALIVAFSAPLTVQTTIFFIFSLIYFFFRVLPTIASFFVTRD